MWVRDGTKLNARVTELQGAVFWQSVVAAPVMSTYATSVESTHSPVGAQAPLGHSAWARQMRQMPVSQMGVARAHSALARHSTQVPSTQYTAFVDAPNPGH
jgi:hypothetical protein